MSRRSNHCKLLYLSVLLMMFLSPTHSRGSDSGDDWTLTDSDTTLVTTPAPATVIPKSYRPLIGQMSPRLASDWSAVSRHSVLHQEPLWPETSPETRGQTPSTSVKLKKFKIKKKKLYTAFEKFNSKSVKYFVLNFLSLIQLSPGPL